MRPMLRLVVALFLVAVAWPLHGQSPANRAYAELSLGNWYSTNLDQISNVPIAWEQRWLINMNNVQDTGEIIRNPVFQLQTTLPLLGFWPPSVVQSPPTYSWNFEDLKVGDLPPRHLPENVWLNATTWVANNQVTERPRFALSRAVVPETLSGAETLQTVTVTLRIDEPLTATGSGLAPNTLYILIGNLRLAFGEFELVKSQFVSQVPVQGWNSWTDGAVAGWSIDPQYVEVGRIYVFAAVLRSIKSPDLLGAPLFKPAVNIDYNRTEFQAKQSGTTTSIQHPTQPVSVTFSSDTPVDWDRAIVWPRTDIWLTPVVSQLTSPPAPFRVIVPATVRIEPETLNLRAQGVLTAFIQIPKPYRTEDVDVSTVTCEGALAQSATFAAEKLVLKFRVRDLQTIAPGNQVKLTVKGRLKDGSVFEAFDTLRVIQ